ncbi:SRPBCC family protein [Arthrobacter sp. Z1-15]
MNKFTRYATTSQTLSLTAMEEASRRGLREADLEDMFLALVLNDQPAGQVLRDAGISIHSARTAVEAYQKDQIASLGITAELPPPGDIVFHETGGYAWSRRASDLLGRAGQKGRTGDASAVLRELLNEPSGLITGVLQRLGTAPAKILAELERTESSIESPKKPAAGSRGEATGSFEAFVPAPVEDVWALLSDPARIPEWEPGIGSVEDTGGPLLPGHTWTAHATLTSPDGKPLKVHEKFRHREIELLEARPPAQVTWHFTFPDTRASRPTVICFELAPATGGTQVSITLTWFRHQGWRAMIGTLLAPLQRFLVWIKLSQIGSSVSRVFRQS